MNVADIFISISGEAGKENFLETRPDKNTEVSGYALPEVLDATDVLTKAKQYGDYFRSHRLRVGMHGPVLDLHYESRDPKVRAVATERIAQGLEIASCLGAEFMVAHSNYNALQASPKYAAGWCERTAEFWKPMADVAAKRNVRLVFENIWDARPEMIKEVIGEIDSPFFKACFDSGHFNIFSTVSIEEWVGVWGEDLAHLHLHNNFGKFDEHNEFSQGTFLFEPFFAAMQRNHVHPTMTIEVKRREDVLPSLELLKKYLERYGS